MPIFRLDKEKQHPWIPVVGVDGSARNVNLTEVFSTAGDIAALGGTPLEAAAITRFLLAIVHLTDTPASLDAWAKLWQGRTALMTRCAKYVASHGDAWDLFHKLHPFGQVSELSKTSNPAHLLVYEAARKNNAVLVDHSIEDSACAIEAPVLARGLVTTNAYAGSSGGGYRSGPLAMRAIAMLCGRTLDETLLLNLLVQPKPPAAYDWKTYGHGQDGATASLDLVRRYLWTSRRVRLMPDTVGLTATTMMLAPGNEMPDSERGADPMVVMRKDAKGETYVPLRLDVGRALWRSAHVLLNWHEDARPLAAVDQLHKLLLRELLPADQPVSMRACGVAGDAQGPSTELWRDEMLPFGLSVIADERRYARLVNAVNTAEDAAKTTRNRIYSFAARYLQNGTASSPDTNDIKRLTDELSSGLGDFWAVIAPAGERIACDDFDERAWAALLKQAADESFQKAIDRLPPDARRHRAQFAPRNGSQAKQKKGAPA